MLSFTVSETQLSSMDLTRVHDNAFYVLYLMSTTTDNVLSVVLIFTEISFISIRNF